METKRAFAVAAHPDDIEFMMAGTLIQLTQAEYEIHYMTVANGSCSSLEHDSQTTIQIRRQESMEAAVLVSAVYHESICNDIEVFYDKENLQRLGAVMREVAPDIVLTHAPQDKGQLRHATSPPQPSLAVRFLLGYGRSIADGSSWWRTHEETLLLFLADSAANAGGGSLRPCPTAFDRRSCLRQSVGCG